MVKKANGHGGHLPTYKSYVFKDKDPAIDAMRTLIEKHYGQRLNGRMLREIAEGGGPSETCMRGWFFRTTKRPQNATLEAAGREMGYERVWRRSRSNK
ncbi:MAG: hypothetical protein J2P55_03770 [Rhizobiales bacterium]|nr:hypothetical protein [Hyphomicrobiales bacterium]